MDITEYDTNALLINNVSSIVYRILEPVAVGPSPYTFSASDVEDALRSDGCLVYADASRRVLWCFHLNKKDGSTTAPMSLEVGGDVDVCGYTLRLAHEGNLEPSALPKPRLQALASLNTPNSSSSSSSALDSSQRSLQASNATAWQRNSAGVGSDADSKGATQAVVVAADYGQIPAKEVYESFLTALLSSLSRSFCSEVCAIPLNLGSLLLLRGKPPYRENNSSNATMAAFRVYVTTAGSLVVSLSLSVVRGLVSAADMTQYKGLGAGVTVLAAPLGAFATLHADVVLQEDGDLVQSPDTQLTRVRPGLWDKSSGWKAQCAKVLQARGIQPRIIDGSPWLTVQSLRSLPTEQGRDGKRTPLPMTQPTILWPAVLCFAKRTGGTPLISTEAEGHDEWSDTYDPLGAAQAWYQGQDEREEQVSKRKTERDRAAAVHEGAELEARHQQPPLNAYSPVALRRSSNSAAAAAGAMYPTPPDVMHVHPPGVTSSLDGTVSSPGRHVGAVATTADMDTVMAGSGVGEEEAYGEVWDGHGPSQRDRPGGAFLVEPSNMFGDLGEDMFADTDITDADFSFFDEQPGGADLDMAVMADVGTADTGNALDTAPADRYDNDGAAQASSSDMKPPDTPGSPKFAKPELRHARSILDDENRHRQLDAASSAANQSPAAGIKRESSPFNPDAIFKRIKASMGSPAQRRRISSSAASPKRRPSVFEKVDFDTSLQSVNEKYLEHGEFGYLAAGKANDAAGVEPIDPTVPSYGGRKPIRSRSGRKLRALPSNIGNLIADLESSHSLLQQQQQQQQQSPIKAENASSVNGDGIGVSSVYDAEDSSYHSDDGMSAPAQSPLIYALAEEDNASVVISAKDTDIEREAQSQAQSMVDVMSHLAGPHTPDVSLVQYFSEPETVPLQLSISDEELIQVAQIITEQAVTGRLRLSGVTNSGGAVKEKEDDVPSRRDMATLARHCLQTLQAVLPRSLGPATACRFRPFVDIQDLPLLGPPGRLQPRPPAPTDQPRSASVFPIAAPHLEVRRSENRLSVLPSAVGFWEGLGLGPSSGPKDVSACCVFPDWEGVSPGASALLDRLRTVYDSLKLGSFEQLPEHAAKPKRCHALVPVDMESRSASPGVRSGGGRQFAPSLSEHLSRLAHALSCFSLADRNVVVYFVYLPDRPGSVVEACLAFQGLFEAYKRCLSERRKGGSGGDTELVLQLIPLDLVASAHTVALVQPRADFVSLCLETYDRCTLFGGPMPAPAVALEVPPPRHIEFRFAPEAANPLHENAHMHIAYAQSPDGRWVSAAWTDNTGRRQMTASYCLGRSRHGRPLPTPFSEVAHEMWETTHDLISVWKVHWRIVIVKCGSGGGGGGGVVMDQQEADFWAALASTESKASVSLALLTVDTNPSLQLLPPAVKVPLSAPSVFYTTPVSTPQPNAVVSPEQSGANGNPATPSMPATPMTGAGAALTATPPSGAGTGAGTGTATDTNPATDPDADSVLVDMTDTTWGVVALHRLPNPAGPFDTTPPPAPALASGYLVKRGGVRPEDPPAVMEVSVVYSDSAPPRAYMYEALLRETLGHFRNLGTLARARAVVDRETDVRPWHVAAAEKGVQVLGALL